MAPAQKGAPPDPDPDASANEGGTTASKYGIIAVSMAAAMAAIVIGLGRAQP